MKKTLALILTLSVLIGSVFALGAFSIPAAAADVTEIASAEDFAKISENLGGSYKLTADITLTQGLSYGNEGAVFTGVFDGDGHTITVNYTDTDQRTGIFCTAGGEGCTIKNLTVDGTITSKNNSCGGVVGTAKGQITFENVTSKVTISAPDSDSEGSSGIGGILGVNEGQTVTFKNCTSSATITGKRGVGGFLGLVRNGGSKEVFEGCTFDGSVRCVTEWSDKRAAGGFIGIMHHQTNDEVDVTFKNCASNGTVTSDNDVLASAWVGSYARWGHPDSLPVYENCTQTAKVVINGIEISKVNDTRYPEGMDAQTSGRVSFDADTKTVSSNSNLAMNDASVAAAVASGYKVYVGGVLDETATVTADARKITVVSSDPTVTEGKLISIIVVFGDGHFTTMGQSVEITWDGNEARRVSFTAAGANANAEDVEKNLNYNPPAIVPDPTEPDPTEPPATETEFEYTEIEYTVNGIEDSDERAAQSDKMGTGVFWRDQNWEGSTVTFTKAEVNGNTVELSFTHEGSNSFGAQFFYNPEGTVNGTTYKVALKITASVTTTITVNGTAYDLTAGQESVIEYLVTADMHPENTEYQYGTSVVAIQFGVKDPFKDIVDGDYAITIDSIAVQSVKAPSAGGDTETDPTAPPTGSAAIAIAAVAVISLAGVAVAAKKREQD